MSGFRLVLNYFKLIAFRLHFNIQCTDMRVALIISFSSQRKYKVVNFPKYQTILLNQLIILKHLKSSQTLFRCLFSAFFIIHTTLRNNILISCNSLLSSNCFSAVCQIAVCLFSLCICTKSNISLTYCRVVIILQRLCEDMGCACVILMLHSCRASLGFEIHRGYHCTDSSWTFVASDNLPG